MLNPARVAPEWWVITAVVVLALASFVTVVLDLIIIQAWIPDAILLGVVLLALAAWSKTRNTWAPVIAGVVATVFAVGNLMSPFVNYRLFDLSEPAFFVTTWIGAIAGLLAAPAGIIETRRRWRMRRTAGAAEQMAAERDDRVR